jgi:hypothetical protein
LELISKVVCEDVPDTLRRYNFYSGSDNANVAVDMDAVLGTKLGPGFALSNDYELDLAQVSQLVLDVCLEWAQQIAVAAGGDEGEGDRRTARTSTLVPHVSSGAIYYQRVAFQSFVDLCHDRAKGANAFFRGCLSGNMLQEGQRASSSLSSGAIAVARVGPKMSFIYNERDLCNYPLNESYTVRTLRRCAAAVTTRTWAEFDSLFVDVFRTTTDVCHRRFDILVGWIDEHHEELQSAFSALIGTANLDQLLSLSESLSKSTTTNANSSASASIVDQLQSHLALLLLGNIDTDKDDVGDIAAPSYDRPGQEGAMLGMHVFPRIAKTVVFHAYRSARAIYVLLSLLRSRVQGSLSCSFTCSDAPYQRLLQKVSCDLL